MSRCKKRIHRNTLVHMHIQHTHCGNAALKYRLEKRAAGPCWLPEEVTKSLTHSVGLDSVILSLGFKTFFSLPVFTNSWLSHYMSQLGMFYIVIFSVSGATQKCHHFACDWCLKTVLDSLRWINLLYLTEFKSAVNYLIVHCLCSQPCFDIICYMNV